ncbi:hypothetical protein SAMN04488134_10448 [Amphibacillus marinus]|uniref:Uncharacterized protein n=1 Tax=Amphibacillus marinus TaxID=872970 RepID=A0A1H8M6E1_9BACI|nr:hypothetical protein [Amphibacillus marinus]SEO12929.1 hypothetical protein SAMN04488134_10448 [Amphibacillus marinus]
MDHAIETRFNRLEDMIGQLINMVASIKEDYIALKAQQDNMRKDQVAMREDITELRNSQNKLQTVMESMKEDNETRHREIFKGLSTMEADRDLIWEKSIFNEREIAKMRPHVFTAQ